MKRKYPLRHYIRGIAGEIVAHPANRAHPYRAVARGLRWQVRKRVVRKPFDIDYRGMVLRCYPDSGSASNVFYFTSRYDYHEMGFLDRYLRPGDGFLDIGANIGTYSLYAASRTGRAARIDAFEPLPRAADRARENFALNGLTNAEVHRVAVGSKPGTADFLDFDVSSSVDHDTRRKGDLLQVDVARIADLVEGRSYAFAKVDVEGVELEALRGAEPLIERCDPPVWMIEVFEHQLEKHATSARILDDWMHDHGFTAAWYDADTRELSYPTDAWTLHANLIYIADSRRAEVEARLRDGALPG